MTTLSWQEMLRPGIALREVVRQATAALVAMDAERLEELARCCADLNRELQQTGEISEAAAALREAEGEMRLLGRVLFETRANLSVLSRLRMIRIAASDGVIDIRGLTYSPRHGQGSTNYLANDVAAWPGAETRPEYGDN